MPRHNFDHLVFLSSDNLRPRMHCQHCGATEPLSLPLTCRQFDLLCRDFRKRHTHCPPPREISNLKSQISNS
jgi:hypothetical protein